MRFDKLVQIQTRLFERAHEESCELKPLGYAIARRGIDPDRACVDPSFIQLPWDECEVLSGLSTRQRNVITAMYFANFYARAAGAEKVAIDSNMLVADRLFDTASDEWMILFHETAEEYDHIICFRAVHRAFTAGTEFLRGATSPDLAKVGDIYERVAARNLQAESFGSFILFVRYVLNVTAKQSESFMLAPEATADPIATAITVGHRTDEARHLTTSLELASHFYESAQHRSYIKATIAALAGSMIRDRFSAELRADGFHHSQARAALRLAAAHPELEGVPLDVDRMAAIWRDRGLTAPESPGYAASRRWLAKQLRALDERLELGLRTDSAEFERYEALAKGGEVAA